MNEASLNRLAKCHPELSRRVLLLAANLAELGILIECVQGLRTFAEQNALFAQGRTMPGQIVTRARGGQSNHCYALAADVVPFENGQPNWNVPNSVWFAIGKAAEKLGLEWGGDWHKFIDKPHVQLPGLSVVECLGLYQRGGLDAVWHVASERLGAKVETQPQPIPAPQTAPSQKYPTLMIGEHGAGVIVLQDKLLRVGLFKASQIDGQFGKITKGKVIEFQKAHGLTADGTVNDRTWAALDEALKGR